MRKLFILGCSLLVIQSSLAHRSSLTAVEVERNIQSDFNVIVVLSIYRWGTNNAEGITIGLQHNRLSCQYLSNTPEPIDSTYTHYVIGMPKFESIRLTSAQEKEIQKFIKPIFMNSFMYIERLTEPVTYSDGYIFQLRINGQLCFESFGLINVPYFTKFIQYIVDITPGINLDDYVNR